MAVWSAWSIELWPFQRGDSVPVFSDLMYMLYEVGFILCERGSSMMPNVMSGLTGVWLLTS